MLVATRVVRIALLIAIGVGGCAQCGPPRNELDVVREAGIDAPSPDIGTESPSIDHPDIRSDSATVCDADGCCLPVPTPVRVNQDAGSGCGDGCTVVAGAAAANSGLLFGERAGEVEYSDDASWFRTDLSTGVTVRTWPQPLVAGCNRSPSGLGGVLQGVVTTLYVYNSGTAFGCSEANGQFLLHDVDRRTNEDCVLYRDPSGYGAVDLVRVNHAWAWVGGVPPGVGKVFVLRDGTPDPFVLDPAVGNGDVTYLVGSGDTLMFVRRPPTTPQEIVISREPFVDLRAVWISPGSIGPLTSDPENLSHVVFDASDSNEVCGAHGDIFFVDVSTAETIPPHHITSNAITEVEPRIRGDRIAYVDFADDTLNPSGCVDSPHNATSLVTTSLIRGGRVFVRSAPGITWLGRDRVWFPWGLNTAYQLLPPE